MSGAGMGEVIAFPGAKGGAVDGVTAAFLELGMVMQGDAKLAARMVSLLQPRMHEPAVQAFAIELIRRLAYEVALVNPEATL